MTYPRIRSRSRRASALLSILCLIVATLMAPVIGVVTAAPAQAATNRLPLLLVHGYSDDCHDAFNFTSRSFAASYDVTTESYLAGHGFSDVRPIGYYNGTWSPVHYDNGTTTTGSDDTSSGNCAVNVQNDSAAQSHCNANWAGTSLPLYTADPIEHLACLFAWYVYGVNTGAYGQAPTAVDVLAHSMGGLVTRAAEYYTSASPSHDGYQFPPQPLRIRRVVTVGTPHGGLQGALAWFYNQSAFASQEITDMTVCPRCRSPRRCIRDSRSTCGPPA